MQITDAFAAGNTPVALPDSTVLMVDGQQRPIGEYTIVCDQRLYRYELLLLFEDRAVRDFWQTNQISYLVRLVPDPGLAEVRKRLASLDKIDSVSRNR